MLKDTARIRFCFLLPLLMPSSPKAKAKVISDYEIHLPRGFITNKS